MVYSCVIFCPDFCQLGGLLGMDIGGEVGGAKVDDGDVCGWRVDAEISYGDERMGKNIYMGGW